MPAVPDGPLTRQQAQQVSSLLERRLLRQVALEVWTRKPQAIFTGERDDERHGQDALDLIRQLKTLHPMLTLTPYNLDAQERIAAERGIEHSPTVTMRCGGRGLRTVGLFFGPFFQAFLDALGLISMGETPLAPATKERLRAIESEVVIEAFLTPFDPLSVQMVPLLAAFAVEGKRFRVTLYEASQFPVLAGKRMVSQVPLITINGKRFVGHYGETQLSEQIARVVEGNDEPVVRDRVLAVPYISADDARRLGEERARAAAQAGNQPPPGGGQPPTGSSGLFVPGR